MKSNPEFPRPTVCPFLEQHGYKPATCKLTGEQPEITMFCCNRYMDGLPDFARCSVYSLFYWGVNTTQTARKAKAIFSGLPLPEGTSEPELMNEIVQQGRIDGAT